MKALHIASFHGNIGDSANHNGFRNKLREALKCEVEYSKLEIREFYQSWGMRDFNSVQFIDHCNTHDLIIIGGGNFFELQWDYSYTGTTVNISNETLDEIKPPILFNALGCDIGQGASINAIQKFKGFIDKITKSKRYLVSLRNDGSFDTAVKILGERYANLLHRVPDPAFFLKTKTFDFPEINPTLKNIGVNVTSDMIGVRFGTKNSISYDEFIVGFAKVINSFLAERNDYQVIFFPHVYSDLLAINKVIEGVNDVYRRTRIKVAPYLTGEGSEEYIFGMYKKCDLIIGMRFHSNVCAIAQNVPSIALSSYPQIDYLYEELKLLNRVVKINERGFEEDLKRKINNTIENTDEIKIKYAKINKEVYDNACEYYELISSWISSNALC